MPLHKLPLIMAFNVQKLPFWYTKFQKSPYLGRGTSPPPPPAVASLPSLWPLLTNPGYTTVTDIAKEAQGTIPPPIPVDWSKRIWKGGVGNWYMSFHITYPQIMAFNVQKCRFDTRNVPNLPNEGGGHPHPPPARLLRSLALATVDKSWQSQGAQGPMPLPPPPPWLE